MIDSLHSQNLLSAKDGSSSAPHPGSAAAPNLEKARPQGTHVLKPHQPTARQKPTHSEPAPLPRGIMPPKNIGRRTRPRLVGVNEGAITVDLAIYSKLVSPYTNKVAGLPMGFVLHPRDFGKAFKVAATPPPEARANAGLAVLDPATRDGAWRVRVIGDFAYLACQRYVRTDPSAPHLHNAKNALQTNFLEQITFRVPTNTWQQHAANLTEAAMHWLGEQQPFRNQVKTKNITAQVALQVSSNTKTRTEKQPIDMSALALGIGDPGIAWHTELLPAGGNTHPFVTLVAQLSPEQLRWASLAYGYRRRIAGISLQLFEFDRVQFTGGLGIEAEKSHVAERTSLLKEYSALREKPNSILRWMAPKFSFAPREEIEVALDRIMMFRSGCGTNMACWSDESLITLMRVFDLGMDLNTSQGIQTHGLAARYAGFLQSIFVGRSDALGVLLPMISRLEFAPNILAELHTHNPALTESVLEILVELKANDATLFNALTARMTHWNYTDFPFWGHLTQEYAARRHNVTFS